jgi:hypothetical protein
MVAGVAIVVVPEDGVGGDEEEAGHEARVALDATVEVTFEGGADAAGDHTELRKLLGVAALDAKSLVELAVGIGDGAGGGPITLEECRAFLDGSLINEEDRLVVGVGFRSTAEIAHCLARKESAEVTEEDDKGGIETELIAQGARAEVAPGSRGVEDYLWERRCHRTRPFMQDIRTDYPNKSITSS